MSKSELKRSELINRLVINYQTTEDLGKLDEILLEIEQHQVKGFISKSGLLGREKRSFLWNQIQTIGQDSILVNYETEVELKSSESIQSLIGAELWTDSGNKVGVITDYLINSKDGKIISYLFTSQGWKGITEGVYCLSTTAIVSSGNKRLIANTEAVEKAEQYSEGLAPTINKVTEFIKEDYEKTMKDLNVVKEGSQNLATQTTEKIQEVSNQLRETVEKKASPETQSSEEDTVTIKDNIETEKS
jgi:uncharacterized protein YrrD